MDTKTILNKVSEIENGAYGLNHLKDMARATDSMSQVSDIHTLRIFVQGLAVELDSASTALIRVWNKAYTLEQELEKELASEPTIDQEVTV